MSSITACAEVVGATLATRNAVFSIVPGTLDEADLRRQLEHVDAAAIIKVGRHLPKIRRVLQTLGLEANARYVERATMMEQNSMPLSEFSAEQAPYFSIVLVHKRGLAWN